MREVVELFQSLGKGRRETARSLGLSRTRLFYLSFLALLLLILFFVLFVQREAGSLFNDEYLLVQHFDHVPVEIRQHARLPGGRQQQKWRPIAVTLSSP